MSLRIRENLSPERQDVKHDLAMLTQLVGEYIDEFTTIDLSPYLAEIFARRPKCMIPGWKPEKLPKSKPIDTKPFRMVDKITARIQRATNIRTGREKK